MPGVLSRYLIGRLLIGMLIVSLLLVGLYTLIELIREARALGGDYQVVQMVVFLAETMPRRWYDIFPFAALIGVMAGMGGLAAGNELVAMRAAGFDRNQIILRVLAAVGLCLLILVMLAEWVIPDMEADARASREQARSGQIQHGKFGSLWLRDGDRMIRIGLSVWLDDQQLEFGDITLYDLPDGEQPTVLMVARRAVHSGSGWILSDVLKLEPGRVGPPESISELTLDSDLRPELFAATVSRPRLLSLVDLTRMRALLSRNGLDPGRYDEAFWERVYFPLNVLAMVLIGLPFVFRGQRQGNQGLNLFIGVSLGLLFFVLIRLAQGVAGIIPAPLWLTFLMPSATIAAGALILLRRR